MKQKALFLVCVVASVGMAEVDVSNTVAAQTYGEDTVLVPETVAADSLPDVGTPIFWFDCSDRTGWTIDPETKAVTSIPSKTGDGRSLATAFSEPGNWTGWSGGSVAPLGPVLVEDVPELQGGALLDFGEWGSGRGLIFNPLAATATATYPNGSNVLENIGTVVAVYDSSVGGGFLFGGGYGVNNVGSNSDGMHYIRGASHVAAATGSTFSYRDPVFRVQVNNVYSEYAPTQAINGVVWQNGIPTTPHFTGFSGGWEVLAFEPRSYKECPVLLPHITGIGINDTRSGYRQSSGGMKIAEMIFYGKVLSAAERQKVEAYLAKKWFGRSIRGHNGNARLGDVRVWKSGWLQGDLPNLMVSASEGETLTIERLRGGRGRSKSENRKPTLIKDGTGALALGEACENGLEIELRQGTLAFERRAVPTNLPWGVLFHVDASKLETMERETVGGVQYVSHWDAVEQLPLTGFETRLCSTSIVDVASRPWLIPDVFGPGMGVVDFGVYGSGRCFRIVRKNASEPIAKYKGVTTVIAVVGAQNGGGNLMEDDGSNRMGYFWRSYGTVNLDTALLPNDIAHPATHPSLKASEGVVFLDGVRADPTKGYPDPGYHLLAIQTPGSQLSTVGGWAYAAANGARSGGMRIAELVIYDRVLTEHEFMDAQAYLNAKWFKRRTPGYEAPKGTSVAGESRAVVVEGDSTIEVSGGTVQLDALSSPTRRRLVKTGDGALIAPKIDLGEVEVRGGSLRLAPDGITNVAMMAEAPAFHLDVTAANTFDIKVENGTNFVQRWYDTSFRNLLMPSSASSAKLPWITTDAADLDGLPGAVAAVDFGATNRCTLNFGRPLDSIRSAFVVWRPGHESSSILGSSSANGTALDFARHMNSASHPLFYLHGSTYPVLNGVVKEDGEVIASPSATPPSEGWHLIEVHPTCPIHASALCADRGNVSGNGVACGGSRYAEIILYTRELSERERTATRNYLRQKWFGVAPEPLPEAERQSIQAGTWRVDGEESVSAEDDIVADRIVGAGTLVKSGSGTMEVDDITALTGKVTVAEGAFALKLPPPAAEGEFITDGLILHLDADVGVTTESDPDTSEPRVTRWDSADGGGWYAVPGTYGVVAKPVLINNARAGHSAANLSTNEHQYMVFMDPNGVQAPLTNIRSVVWVMNTREGGGMLLGGGRDYPYNHPNNRWNFHRGTKYRLAGDTEDRTVNAEFKVGCSLLSGNGQGNLHNGSSTWRVNGSAVGVYQQNVLSGDWDMISMAMSGNDQPATEAEALACDGRTIASSSFYQRSGGQLMGELLVYSNALTSAQIEGLEAYLKRKWGFVRPQVTNLAEVAVAEGAALDLQGSSQYLAAISGGGVVSNGVLTAGAVDSSEGLDVDGDLSLADGAVWSIAVGADGCETLAVDGTLTFGPNLTIALSGLEGRRDLREKTFTLAAAGTLVGAENILSATVATPGLPPSINAVVSVDGNAVKVRFKALGLSIIFR